MLSSALRVANLKQAQLAKDAGITYYAFRQYWYGKRTAPPAVLKRIAKALRAHSGKLQHLADDLERAASKRR
jgi:transcriptional regulator with XRE-family HTH domain